MDTKVKKMFTKPLLFFAMFLSLTGCGRQESVTTDTAKTEDTKAQTEGKAAETEVGGIAEDILADLIKDEVFQMCVWRDAGIETGDTKELILQKLEQCESLSLDKSSIENIFCSLEYLSLLPNLKSLTIIVDSWDSCEVEDFTPVAELSRLEQLYIKYDMEEEIDLSFLAGMGTVKELYLPNCRIKDISFLEEMPQLEHLSLYETPVDDLAVLEKLPKLTELSIAGNADARNIEVIGKLSKLQDLGLQGCGIADIGFLSSLTELRSINLNDNSITDVTPLACLTKLERLGAGRNKIKDISPLAALSDLYDLALDGNEISDE